MMTPRYRFFLQVGDDGTKVAVYPIYKDDLSLDYELETNQRFYRAKLTGKLTFVNEDYDLVMDAEFDTVYYLYIEISTDFGVTWSEYHKSKFMRTDCTIREHDKTIVVQPDTIDQYNNVLAGLDKEYNLIECKPEVEPLLLYKRPLIQVYIPGDNIVSCFLSGMSWEQDVTTAVSDKNELVSTYHFALNTILKEINLTGDGLPAARGIYSGRMTFYTSGNNYQGILYPEVENGYAIRITQFLVSNAPIGDASVALFRTSDNKTLYLFSKDLESAFDFDEFDLTAKDSSVSGTMHAEMSTYNVYARYLLDVNEINGLATYDIAVDDIVANNRNYHKVIGYAIDIGFISTRYSAAPTQYGRSQDGRYFLPPTSLSGQTFYPLARSTWGYASLWFGFYLMDSMLDARGRQSYLIPDTYPVASAINVLLSQFAPDITHEATPEYSEFLYGVSNPISGLRFKLFVTPKTNLIRGEYQQPAQQAPTTLQQFLNMLRSVFQCYWHIENGKLRIEHVSWYKNGGSYTSTPIVGTDLTTLMNARNDKEWAFATSEYSFDKIDMPERYQFAWADECSAFFEGEPIQVESRYVQEGKIEEINISNFTSDVDLMMLSPENVSEDGFALFAAVTASGLANNTNPGYSPELGESSGNMGYTSPQYIIRDGTQGKMMTLQISASGDTGILGTVAFLDANGGLINEQGAIAPGYNTIEVTIPSNAVKMAYNAYGNLSVYTYSAFVEGAFELPFVEYVKNANTFYLQNGYLAMVMLQPEYWLFDMPASRLIVNGAPMYALGLQRKKKQTISYPIGNIEPNLQQLVRTHLGAGEIEKVSINLSSRTTKTTLKYDTE